jgi:hypothetical protein
MKLTIILSDKLIGIDGVFLNCNQEDIDWIPSNIHAVQWYDTWGEVEYIGETPNERIEELGIYEKAIEVYENETKKIQDELDAIEAVRDYWQELRIIRDSKLGESDWSQMPDSPLSEEKKIEWREYRQELRDLPENITDPKPLVLNLDDPAWPTNPE